MPRKARRPSAHPEHYEQARLFEWAKAKEAEFPQLKLMYAVPNAARRSPRQGKWMKDEGMRSGVPDVVLPVEGNYNPLLKMQAHTGLYIEMKAEGGKPSPEQLDWLVGLRQYRNYTAICYGWQQAAALIEWYLVSSRKPIPAGPPYTGPVNSRTEHLQRACGGDYYLDLTEAQRKKPNGRRSASRSRTKEC